MRGQPATLALCCLCGLAACTTAPPASQDAIGQLLRDQGHVRMAPAGSDQLVLTAMGFVDTPYRLGGHSVELGFDCSGFTRHVYGVALGFGLPRQAEQQAHDKGLRSIEPEDLQPGDLVFFNTQQRAFSHVGLYIGDQRFVHAPRSGALVRIEDMRVRYWALRYNGARRALQDGHELVQGSP